MKNNKTDNKTLPEGANLKLNLKAQTLKNIYYL